MKKKNKIISIGFVGCYSCYLNISEEEAIQRYIKKEDMTESELQDDGYINIHQFEFDDEFEAYSVNEI